MKGVMDLSRSYYNNAILLFFIILALCSPDYDSSFLKVEDSSGGHIVVGENLTLQCKSTFHPDYVTIKWNIPEDNQRTVTTESPLQTTHDHYTSTLTVYQARKQDQGIYECTAMHKKRPDLVFRDTVWVPVYDNTEHTIQFKDENKFHRPDAEIRVDFKAHPAASVTWLDPENRTIRTNSRFQIFTETLNTIEGFNYNTRLQFKRINADDFGFYTVVAQNEFESKAQSIYVMILRRTEGKLVLDSVDEDGMVAKFTCKAVSSLEKPEIRWVFAPYRHNSVEPKLIGQPYRKNESHYQDNGLQIVSSISVNLSETGTLYCLCRGSKLGGKNMFYNVNNEQSTLEVGYSDIVSIRCEAGLFENAIKWYHNEQSVENAQNEVPYDISYTSEKKISKLEFEYISEKQLGNYSCERLTMNGDIRATTVTVVPRNIPSFEARMTVLDLSGGHTVIGSNLELECTVVFYQQVSITWKLWSFPASSAPIQQSKTTTISETTTSNSSAVTTISKLTTVAKEGNSNFLCTAFSHAGANVAASLITPQVYGVNASYIKIWPTKFQKSDLVIEAYIAAHPKPEIKWFFHDREVPSKFLIRNQGTREALIPYYNYISKLVLQNMTVDDFGRYTVAVTIQNPYNRIEDSLLVNLTQTSTLKMRFLRTDNGSNIIECSGTSYPSPVINWYFGKCINFDSCFQKVFQNYTQKRETSSKKLGLKVLSYISLKSTEMGSIMCQNRHNNVSQLLLDVKDGFDWLADRPVVFHNSTKTVEAIHGEEFNIVCAVSRCCYKLEFSLYHNGRRVENKWRYDFLVSIGSRISISASWVTDGFYICSVLTESGALRSKTLLVKSEATPRLHVDTNMLDASRTLNSGSSLKLYCHASGFPTPTVQWFKNGYVVHTNNHFLEFKPVSVDDEGVYECEVSNRYQLRTYSETVLVSQGFNWLLLLEASVLLLIVSLIGLVIIKRCRRIKRGIDFNIALENMPPLVDTVEIPKDKIQLGKLLSSSDSAIVHQATIIKFFPQNERKSVVVKLPPRNCSYECFNELLVELKIMARVGHHLNIVNFLGACTKDRKLYIAMDHCRFGSLQRYLRQNSNTFVDQKDYTIDQFCWQSSEYVKLKQTTSICTKDFLIWAFQIARGMQYLSSHGIIHGNLASRNILLTTNNVIKVSNFALSKKSPQEKWLAVEVLGPGKPLSIQSDVWAFGITLWEMFALGGTPYPDIHFDDSFQKRLQDGYRMKSPETATTKMYRVMLDCWDADPKLRPSFEQLVEKIGSVLEKSVKDSYINMNDYLEE